MGMFDFFKLRKKEETNISNSFNDPSLSLNLGSPTLPQTPPELQPSLSRPIEEKKNNIDSLAAQIEKLQIEYHQLNEKIDRIEKMLKEIYDMAKS